MYSFRNDYSEGAHPKVLQALLDTNLTQTVGYGTDPLCEAARETIRRVCAAPAVSCPPAIALAVSGEVLTRQALALFEACGQQSVFVVKDCAVKKAVRTAAVSTQCF